MEELNMAKVRSYARLVKNRRRTIEQVPAEYREAVNDILEGKNKS